MRRVAFDLHERRPGCALIQAAMGCGADVAMCFPTRSWLVAPSSAMERFELTDEQFDRLVAVVREEWGDDGEGRTEGEAPKVDRGRRRARRGVGGRRSA